MTYGATPEEWAHLDLCLGLTRDLLPVVSDPHARISEQSKMKAVGKTPSRFNGNGDAVGFPEWTQYEAEGKDITRWQRDNRLGVCIQTRRVRALDIDVSDRIPAERIEDAFREATGLDSHLPVRMRDNSGKRLLAFIVEGELPKRKMIVDGGIIELLGNGQQFVACGTHTSGARYTWAGGLPSSLPVLTLDQLDAAWQRLTELFAVEPPTSSTSLRRRGEDLGIVDPVVDYLLAKWETHGEGRDGQVYVTCPWEAEHTSDSGPTASSWIPAGTNGYQQGHYSCLHAHCAGRIDHEFLTAVGYNTADFEPLPEIVLPPSAPFARPWRYRDPASLPLRLWVYNRHYIRRFVSTTVAPGGSGKSALALTEAMAIASGKAILGIEPNERTRVWYFNGEDPYEETERRIAAACIQYGVQASDLEGWLFIGSGRDSELVLADQRREGVTLRAPVVDQVTALIREHDIGVAIVDPFVSSHKVTENDNGAIDTVAKTWGRIADTTGCAVELVHHVRKGQAGVATTVEDGRGASALLAAARSARVLNAMSRAEADKAGVGNASAYFRVTNGKANLAPPSDKSEWYRFLSIDLGNGEFGGGDSVGVVTPWSWPEEVERLVSGEEIAEIQALYRVKSGFWRYDPQSKYWFGNVAAEVLDLDMNDKDAKNYVKEQIDQWINAGFFTCSEMKDEKRNRRPSIEIGVAPPEEGCGT